MKFKIAFKHLPFEPRRKQVIYVESCYNDVVNKFIQKNYTRITQKCDFMGMDFCYIPKLVEEFGSDNVLFYNAPYAKHRESPANVRSDFLLSFMSHPENKSQIPPSLLYIENDEEDERLKVQEVIFSGVSITELDIYVDEMFYHLLDKIDDNSDCQSLFQICEDDDQYSIPYNADLFFDEETQKMALDVWEKIRELEKKGFTRYMLQQFIEGQEKLSRLLITKDFRIFLPDYNNKEILMTPLPKAVFLLFLNHPDGIPFKHLPDYKEELKAIYAKLKPIDTEATERSIGAVTDPCNNSINEKCARIREAFVSQFSDHLAKNYFVTGNRGEAKKITLPRELVVWEE